jgi:hypothetical protein
MRGKQAAQAANRRARAAVTDADTAQQEARRVRAQLAEERRAHEHELRALRDRLPRLAGEMAGADVADRDRQIAELRQEVKCGRDAMKGMSVRQDRLVRNACQALSMVSGLPPIAVLPSVLAWVTDEPIERICDPVRLVTKVGVHPDSWTARVILRVNAFRERMIERAGDVPLLARPAADIPDHPGDVLDPLGLCNGPHPRYKARWYPRYKYEGTHIIDDPIPETSRYS